MVKRFGDAEIAEMIRMRNEGVKVKDIALRFNTSSSTVSGYISGTTEIDANWESKKNWPEWKEWRILHEKYGGGRYKDKDEATEKVDITYPRAD